MPNTIENDFPLDLNPFPEETEASGPQVAPPASDAVPAAPMSSAPLDEVSDAQPDPRELFDAEWAGANRFADAEHTSFPTSDGYPIYRQGDDEWRNQPIGDGATTDTLRAKGCAMSAAAMALSGLSGTTVTPKQLDDFAKSNGAMSGNNISNWSKLGKAVEPKIAVTRIYGGVTPSEIDAQLADHKPVAIGVHYRGEGNGVQHWILVTGKSDGGFRATDPATGKVIEMRLGADGKLGCDAPYLKSTTHHYVFTGDAVTFG